jgi:WD40 repeat protein
MFDTRYMHTATLLADGRVLMVGGYDSSDDPVTSAEVFDPVTRQFSTSGSLQTPAACQGASLLRDGRVLFTGGMDVDGYNLDTAELWDPATGEFARVGPMGHLHGCHTATLLPDGSVLIAGGVSDRSSERYVPSALPAASPAR